MDTATKAALRGAAQANDRRMVALAIEMTRFFCGEQKARQIEQAAGHLATEADWQALRLRPEFVADAAFHQVAAMLEVAQTKTVEAAVVWLSVTGRRPVRSIFGGMMEWVSRGARPTWHGRTDWALHFIFGGWIELATGLGDEAGRVKEELDRVFGTGTYDRGDIEATEAGAAAARKLRSNLE